jgi:hypothetical protein
MAEINLGINAGLGRAVEEVGDKRNWVPVLDGDPVKSAIIDT